MTRFSDHNHQWSSIITIQCRIGETHRCPFWLVLSTKRWLTHSVVGCSPLGDFPTTKCGSLHETNIHSNCGVSPVIELVIHQRFLGFSAASHPRSTYVSSPLAGTLEPWNSGNCVRQNIRIRETPKIRCSDGSGDSGVFKHRGFSCSIWVCLKMSCTPLYPMVLLIIIPFLKMAISLGILTQHFQTNPF